MQTQNVKLTQLKANEANPRTITAEKFDKLVTSLLVFPSMLELRPIVVDGQLVVLGGNMRLRALTAIATMSPGEILGKLNASRDFAAKTATERDRLTEYWNAWLDNPTATVTSATSLTDAEKREFIIKDNVGFGEWDFDALANEWDSAELNEWGVGAWDDGLDPDKLGEGFSLPDGDKPTQQRMAFIVSDSQSEAIKQALSDAMPETKDMVFDNDNRNGNALFYIVSQWAEQRK